MRTEGHTTALSAIAISWIAAVAAAGWALIVAVIGQGLGAAAGGCDWIGASIPLHRQVWALVNQPVLNFSSLPGAGGYWLGSLLLPLLVGLAPLAARPKTPTLVGQLTSIQTMWWMALVGGVWLPLLDPDDGHIARWLVIHRLPPVLVWVAPAAATVLGVYAAARMLEIARRRRPDMGRAARVATVGAHLLPPVAGWLWLIRTVAGTLPLRPVIGIAAPLAAVTIFAWCFDPGPYPRPLKRPFWGAVAMLVAGALCATGAIWWAGRPLPEDRVSGVLWGVPGSFNNIRPWIDTGATFPGNSAGDSR